MTARVSPGKADTTDVRTPTKQRDIAQRGTASTGSTNRKDELRPWRAGASPVCHALMLILQPRRYLRYRPTFRSAHLSSVRPAADSAEKPPARVLTVLCILIVNFRATSLCLSRTNNALRRQESVTTRSTVTTGNGARFGSVTAL